MQRFAALLDTCKQRYARLRERVMRWLDRHADEQAGGWGARMEYKRRYTNPDDAKRARTGPDFNIKRDAGR